MLACCRRCDANATGSGMSYRCGRVLAHFERWQRPSLQSADDEGAAEYAAKISKEADALRTGDPELLSHMIREGLDRAEGKPERLLLYVDQWEELYAQAPPSTDGERATQHAADVNRFIDLLLAVARTAPVAVVGTVRADFYDPFIGHEEMKSLLPSCQVLLGKMQRSDLEQTIVEAARKVGLVFDPPEPGAAHPR